MRYENVCLESFGYTLPEEIVTSDELEHRLAPLYQRLRLPEGRLELITGIRERRFWPVGSLPSTMSIQSAERAIEASGIDREQIGALIHGSVCRDHLEPATASRVHHELGLPSECLIYDVSNACLGLLNGMLQVANMIELGQIRAGLVVGSEDSRHLLEATIEMLNRDESLTRETIKQSIASLTIGSASCAILLCRRDLSETGNRLTSAAVRANTRYHRLCHSGADEAVGEGMSPLMATDSEQLLLQGIETGAETFLPFLAEAAWQASDLDKTFCHQVGPSHRNRMLAEFGIDPKQDFTTVEWLGNTGSVALPVTMAIGIENGWLTSGDRVGMLGIGSGINSIMMAVEWRKSLLQTEESRPACASATSALSM